MIDEIDIEMDRLGRELHRAVMMHQMMGLLRVVVELEAEASVYRDKLCESRAERVQLSRELAKFAEVDVCKVKMTFDALQDRQRAWVAHNFGPHPYHHPLMGAVEEMGELHHALLKQEQGIRGTWSEHEASAKDAVGDIIIYLTDLCTSRGWSLQDVIEETWQQVEARDWRANPEKGTADVENTQG